MVLNGAEDLEAAFRLHLQNKYRIDAKSLTVLEGFKKPRTLTEQKNLLLSGVMHTLSLRILDAKKEALAAVVAGRDPYTAMISAVQTAYEEANRTEN